MPGSNVAFAGAFTQFGYAVKFCNEIEKLGASNTPNLLDMEDVAATGLDGEHIGRAIAIMRDRRERVADLLEPEALREFFRPYLEELCRSIGTAPEGLVGSDYDLLKRVRDYMVANAQTLNSRGMTLDQTASGSPVGNFTAYRCIVDAAGMPLECTGAEAKRFTCLRDQTSGAEKHAEVFEFAGATPSGARGLHWSGSGAKREVSILHAGSGLLRNGSFESNGAAADNVAPGSTTAIDGWTVATAANWRLRSNAAYVYRGYPGNPSTLWGLECVASDSITQILRTASPGAAFSLAPHLPWVRWKRLASATGTLTAHLGSKSVAATIGSFTNGVWNTLVLGPGQDNHYDRFRQDELDFRLVVATLATGTIAIDDCGLAPMLCLDGTYWALLGGDTPAARLDEISFTDVDGTRALFSYWLWRAYVEEFSRANNDLSELLTIGGWLPTDNAGTETVTDPA
jgi:hypothetical protein